MRFETTAVKNKRQNQHFYLSSDNYTDFYVIDLIKPTVSPSLPLIFTVTFGVPFT